MWSRRALCTASRLLGLGSLGNTNGCRSPPSAPRPFPAAAMGATSKASAILSAPEKDRGMDGLSYLNKTYEKYITLVENSAILNPMNKHDQLLVIDPRLLISGGSSIDSEDFNHSPIIKTDEDEL